MTSAVSSSAIAEVLPGMGTSKSSTIAADAVASFLNKKDGFWGPKMDERIECPHCSRQFAEKAAARHIPKCSVMKSKPRPPVLSNTISYTDNIGRRIQEELVGSPTAPSQHLVPTPQQKEVDILLTNRIEDQYAEVSLVLQDRTLMDTNESIDELVQRCRRLTLFLADMAVRAEKENTDRGVLTKKYLKEDHGELTTQAKSMRNLLKIKLGDDTDIELCRHSCLNILALIANIKEMDAKDPAAALKNFIARTEIK